MSESRRQSAPRDPRQSSAAAVRNCVYFYSLNKLALGIADSLALSIAADGIGAGWGAMVAPSMNVGLWQHPRTAESLERLRSWGVQIIEPAMDNGVPRLAPNESILEAVRRRLAGA